MIFETKAAEKAIDRLPKHVLEKYGLWLSVVRISGVDGLRRFVGFRDEALVGKLRGCRSSRLNRQYRVIYSVSEQELMVEVIDVNAHDYR